MWFARAEARNSRHSVSLAGVVHGVLKLYPQIFWPALGFATLGNTLGGMTSYFLGRAFPQRQPLKGLHWVQRYGSPSLFFAWAPIVGDALCVAAGWLRVNAWAAALFMTAGKFARYWLIAQM